MSAARVVIDVACSHNHDQDKGQCWYCAECDCKGTIEREVHCDGCKWFGLSRSLGAAGVGRCSYLSAQVYIQFACKAWEAKR